MMLTTAMHINLLCYDSRVHANFGENFSHSKRKHSMSCKCVKVRRRRIVEPK